MDIQQLYSHVVFDMSARKAQVISTIHFTAGTQDGNPIFDPRQEIIQAQLNDEMFPVDKLQHHDFGGGPDAELRMIEKVTPVSGENKLTAIYELSQLNSPKSHR